MTGDDPEKPQKRGAMRFICHQRPDRCFHINGRPMSLCARCTGFYPGIIIGVIISILIPFFITLEPWILFILALFLLAPMAADGLTQYFGTRESNNSLRFVTGILAGIAVGLLFGRIMADILL